jgi:hypothetical protein
VFKLYGKSLVLAALLCSTIVFANCSSTPTTNGSNNTVVVNSNNNAKPSTDAPKTGTTTTAAKTGVPECDEYIEKYETCLTSIGEKYPQVQPSLKAAFEAQRKGFTDAAAHPESKASLATSCKQAIETAKQSTSAYACKW